MYKIVIADDEPIMLASITGVINALDEPFEIVATARTGRAAIEQVHALRPDILITDIKMPGINGLDAIRDIKAVLPHISCIVISAFDYFEYVSTALGLGVEQYLLKPLDDDALIAAVRAAAKQVERYQTRLHQDLKLRENIELMRPMVEQAFFSALNTPEQSDDFSNYSYILNGSIMGGYVININFTERQPDEALSTVSRAVKHSAYYQIIADHLRDQSPHRALALRGNRLSAVIFCEPPASSFEQQCAAEVISQELLDLAESWPIQLSIGIGSYYRDPCQLRQSHTASLQALRSLVGGRLESSYLHANDLAALAGDEQQNNHWQVEHIYDEIVHGRLPSALFAFDEWFADLQEQTSDIEQLKGKLVSLLAGFSRFRGALNDDIFHHLIAMLNGQTAAELKRATYAILENLSLYIPSIKEKKLSAVVGKANAYMNVHFGEELTLEVIAGVVNLSPYYFSRIYKEETGENFINTLTAIRIDKAKDLLVNSEQSIKQIAAVVGYADANYFSKLFKKTTDETPTGYRERAK